MLNSYLADALTRQQTVLEQLKTTDTVGAVLSLTRNTTVSLTTAGTLVTWQNELRGYQISWTGSTITIPENGWYLINLATHVSPVAYLRANLVVDGVEVAVMTSYSNNSNATSNVHQHTVMRYFDAGDAVQIELVPSVNVTLSLRAPNTAAESPILHITQLSGPVGA